MFRTRQKFTLDLAIQRVASTPILRVYLYVALAYVDEIHREFLPV